MIQKLFSKLFPKKIEVIYVQCKCGQNVDVKLYRKSISRHIIGQVFKNNRPLTLFCDGKERK